MTTEEIWAKIFEEDQKHIRECGWSYFEGPKKEEEKNMTEWTVWYTDPETGASSPIDTITAPEDYTAADYIRDCAGNADDAWNEMLEAGSIDLIEN